MSDLLAYADEISAVPGQRINFKVSADNPGKFNFQVVHVRCGDDTSDGPGLKLTPIGEASSHPARFQKTQVGSFIRAYTNEELVTGSFTLQAMIWPTLTGVNEQAIMGKWNQHTQSGYSLLVDCEGKLSIKIGDGKNVYTLPSQTSLLTRHWYLVRAAYDQDMGTLSISQQPVSPHPDNQFSQNTIRVSQPIVFHSSNFMIAGWDNLDANGEAIVTGCFNGKIDSPVVFDTALDIKEIKSTELSHWNIHPTVNPVAAWDFSQDMSGVIAYDTSTNQYHGEIINLPARAMKGWNHDASEMNWRHKPEHYGAIHFHEDDLYDCGWQTDVSWVVPKDLKSGTYAAHLTQGEEWFYVPFYVRPCRNIQSNDKKNKLCLLVATASYYAYVNNQMPVTWGPVLEHSSTMFTTLTQEDLHLKTHPEHGLSMYDFHSDGSGVCYASRLRPFMKMGPRSELWQYNADTHITDWLENSEIEFDVITDDDLDQIGADAINGYQCVMTTTHPEYYSKPMMQGLLDYQQQGGKFIYLGGNGFYWRIAYHPQLPGVIELRRAEDGMRSWIAEPGEYYMSFTGELSGLWRRNGIPPEAVCGVGFSAQGFLHSRPYVRTDSSHDPRVSWMFDDIDPDEPIGDFGTVFGGAAGSEIDSADFEMGTPSNALIVAKADDFGVDFHWVNEEFYHTGSAVNGETCPEVRCDMVYYETNNNGAVFSVGSIAFAGSLAHNNYANNVSQLLKNVVDRFTQD